MANFLACYNRGCGQTFEEEKNNEKSCRYHPGEPFFHDAYKGWSCCKKKSVDFTEFLSIKGCTLGKHSNVKPLELEKPVQEIHEDTVQPTPLEQIKRLPRPDISTPMVQLEAKVAPALKESIDSLPPLEKKKINKSSAEIAVGTVCTNAGCNKAYEGSSTDETQCFFHPGVPIFHEGMKYWSCCQKKTSDFTAFMNQTGCDVGKHKWVKDDSQVQAVKCRWDWHQTASNIVVSVYAKMYDYRRSVVQINPIRLYVELVFPQQNDNKFIIDLELRGIIRIEDATVQMLGTKVEICLPKAEPGSWSKLEIPPKKIMKSEIKQEKNEKPIEKDHDSDIDLDDLEMTGVQISEVK
ncbi:cysteine and histidine-rich domain-containing protein morgana [Culicoides brevitarsis]|uniref:cysteine and histidine-rich domain-containing protein morgana n=1 Tax=Culicoides brevitarsis TaxID=469753 RepID=UPI00307C90DA